MGGSTMRRVMLALERSKTGEYRVRNALNLPQLCRVSLTPYVPYSTVLHPTVWYFQSAWRKIDWITEIDSGWCFFHWLASSILIRLNICNNLGMELLEIFLIIQNIFRIYFSNILEALLWNIAMMILRIKLSTAGKYFFASRNCLR